MGLIDIFPDPGEMALSALCVMMFFYGCVLMRASQVIGDGSEMLMLLFGPGIVGGVVIPLLGAVPDCAVILISGMGQGTKEEIQNQLAVGVGTLVGSTVMLLTIPWGIGIYLGRRDFDEVNDCAVQGGGRSKCTKADLFGSCVTVMPDIPSTSRVMLASLTTYMIIQIPSLYYESDKDGGVSGEKPWALFCLIFAAAGFLLYCWLQVQSAESAERDRRLQEYERQKSWKESLDRKFSQKEHQHSVFRMFDRDHSGFIEAVELSAALEHLGLKVSRKDIGELMETIDVGHQLDGDVGKADGRVSLHEFEAAVSLWVAAGQKATNLEASNKSKLEQSLSKRQLYGSINDTKSGPDDPEAYSDEHDDEDDEEEEYWELSESQIRNKALVLLVLGTLVVTIFSDPMVDVITQVGARLQVSPFYVAFVVTPLASNASEVYAGLLFAKKKTNESISMTLATLHGAATMNSTLALSIFAAIIYARGLEWDYTAETVTVVFVVTVVALQSMVRRNIFLWQALLVLSLYPGSIAMVYVLQKLGLK